jgi:sialate O-acetylesterase
MAVLLDTGEKDCIHPAEKQKAGERLALLALAKTYGMKGFGFESPEYKAIEIAGSTVVVSFDNVPNGLTTFGKEISTFEIAGADKRFYAATAQIRSKSIVLASPRVKDPVAVRYAWKDVVDAEIFSTEGLPLSSFRTDDW